MKLTDRETEILQKLSDGKVIDEIAEDFKVTRSSIDRNVRDIRNKLQVETTFEAIKVAIKNQIIN